MGGIIQGFIFPNEANTAHAKCPWYRYQNVIQNSNKCIPPPPNPKDNELEPMFSERNDK